MRLGWDLSVPFTFCWACHAGLGVCFPRLLAAGGRETQSLALSGFLFMRIGGMSLLAAALLGTALIEFVREIQGPPVAGY